MRGSVSLSMAVGMRSKLPPENMWKRGCYVRTAFLNVERDESLETIAQRCTTELRNVRQSERLCDTLAERSCILGSHFYFNKWMLDRIKRDDGRVLRLHRGGHKVEFSYLLSIDQPLEIKVVHDDDDEWSLLATPLWLTFRHAVNTAPNDLSPLDA